MATPRQIAANRENASKSTGPTTPAGKQRSARNALKHGLLAEAPLIPGEDSEAFVAFREALLADLAPVGQREEALAEEYVNLTWRLRRAPQVEAGLLRRQQHLIDVNTAEYDAARLLAEARSEQERRRLAAQMGKKYAPELMERLAVLAHAEKDEAYFAALGRAAVSRDALEDDLCRLAASYDGCQAGLATLSRYETSLFRKRMAVARELDFVQMQRVTQVVKRS